VAIKYPFIEDILRLYAANSSRVLDIGAGTGIYESAFKAGSYSGVDIEVSANKNVFQASAKNMPFDSNSFDLAFGVASIYLVGPECLREIHRVLKSGGTFALFEYRRSVLKNLRDAAGLNHVTWSPRQLRRELSQAKFIRIRRLSHRPSMKSFYLQPIAALKLTLKGSWVIFICAKK
jgi:ubiquinone/menaquinone biosynthesis C-methylase UbiE